VGLSGERLAEEARAEGERSGAEGAASDEVTAADPGHTATIQSMVGLPAVIRRRRPSSSEAIATAACGA
jgi:hypothetical protein